MLDVPKIPEAPAWSLLTGQIGKGCIWTAIVLFVLSSLLWFFNKGERPFERTAKIAFNVACLSIFVAFFSLTLLFLKDQFQFQTVYEHGDVGTDLKYKIAGVWTSQEGSFLFWAATSALFALLTIRGTGIYRRWYTIVCATFLAVLGAILAYDTPFGIIPLAIAHGKIYVAQHGVGLTPSLENYWVVIHPPTIFTGFGSLLVFFAYSVAAMIEGNAKEWVKHVRPWALLTTGILGIGICMGGLWAYETQGWGGFWAWDPVENVSFVPWLFTVVLVHGIIVQVTKSRWIGTNLFLGGLPFVSFVYGTFLTRSGLLDGVSNHSFVSMETHSLNILRWFLIGVSALFVVLFLTLGRRATAKAEAEIKPEGEPTGLNREGLYRFGTMLVSMLAVVITVGMSWPVVQAMRTGHGSKVEENLYHLVVVWFFIPIMLLMAIAPFVSWRSMGWRDLGNRLFSVLCITIGGAGFIQMGLMSPTIGVHAEPGSRVDGPFHTHAPLTLWMLLLISLCLFVVVANVWRIVEVGKRSPLGVGGFIAHAGLAILLGGLIVSRGYEQHQDIVVRRGSPDVGLGYVVSYAGRTETDPFDRSGKVFFDVQGPDGKKFRIQPGLYQYGSQEDDPPKYQVWPDIERHFSHDDYFSMAPPVIEAWPDRPLLKPGDVKTFKDTTLEYIKATRTGQPGQLGVKFGAVVRLTADGPDHERHQYIAEPTVELTEGGLNPSITQISPDYAVAIMGGMNAADHGVQLALLFDPPLYPIRIFYKPFTGLVWLGGGVMTFGGLLSGLSRRRVVARQKREVPKAAGAPAPLRPASDLT